jgi:hypothetical protein
MDQPSQNYCQYAIPVLQQLRQGFGNDSTIMSIIAPSEKLCAKTGATASPTTSPTPSLTPSGK